LKRAFGIREDILSGFRQARDTLQGFLLFLHALRGLADVRRGLAVGRAEILRHLKHRFIQQPGNSLGSNRDKGLIDLLLHCCRAGIGHLRRDGVFFLIQIIFDLR